MAPKHQLLLRVGAALYFIWYFPLKLLIKPDGYDPLPQRVALGSVIALLSFVKSTHNEAAASGPPSSRLFHVLLTVLTLHMAFLSYMNAWDMIYSLAFLITFAACCSTIDEIKHLIAYCTVSSTALGCGLLSSVVGKMAHPQLLSNGFMVFFGLITLAFISFLNLDTFVKQRSRERMLTLSVERERAQAVQANKMASLGEMAAGVAHEINNPLAIIGLAVEDLRTPRSPEAVQHAADLVEKTVSRIAHIVRGLRMFARQSEEDPKENITVKQLIDDTLDMVMARLNTRQIRLEIVFKCKETTVIRCRPYQIIQVLINLIHNATDSLSSASYQGPQGAKEIRVLIFDHGSSVMIRVQDNGPGVPEIIRHKIMKPFFTTKEAGKGTGLGLSISRGIMESHGGSLWLENPPPGSSGAWFVLEIPAPDAKAEPPASPASTAA